MAKFRVQRQATVWVEIIVVADTTEAAEKIAMWDNWENGTDVEDSWDWATDSFSNLWIEEVK